MKTHGTVIQEKWKPKPNNRPIPRWNHRRNQATCFKPSVPSLIKYKTKHQWIFYSKTQNPRTVTVRQNRGNPVEKKKNHQNKPKATIQYLYRFCQTSIQMIIQNVKLIKKKNAES